MSETNFSTTTATPRSPDVLAYASDEPDVNLLQQEYQLAWSQDGDAYGRIAHAEDIRYTRWAGQSADGLQHQELMPEGKRAMPYDRAPDCRVPLADATINSLIDVLYTSFWGARVKTAPAGASRLSAVQAAEWRQIISWMIHGPLRDGLIDQVEFAAQVRETIGWVVLHPQWRRKQVMRLQRLTLDQILALSNAAPQDSVLADLPLAVLDPTLEEAAVQMFQALFPSLKASRARRVVRELRKDKECEFPVPGEVINRPELAVLVPWQDFILPKESTALGGRERAMFRRLFMDEAEIRERAVDEEWDEAFVSAVLKTKGQAMENGTSPEHDADENMQLCELVYAYQRQVSEEGVPGLYCTVFSPHVQSQLNGKQLYGNKWLLETETDRYPFIMDSTEVTGRRPMDARGVPEIVVTSQREMKQQRDATYVYSQMSITPPLRKRGTQASKLPPELGPLGIFNDTTGADWNWFPPPPGKPEIAFKLLEDLRHETEDYFGIARIDTPPMKWQVRQQRLAMRWLAKWGEVFWQLSVMAYQNLSAQELEQILGHQPFLTAQIIAQQQLMLWFDVRAMDPEWVESTLKNVAELVLPVDSAGVVDRAKLVQFALAYLDPTLAEEVTSDAEGAKQKLFKDVRDEVSSVMQGNEALYTENDPTAKVKLGFVNQIVSANPDYQVALASDGRKQELFKKYLDNLGMSAAQQDNKVIGRLGVTPGPGQ